MTAQSAAEADDVVLAARQYLAAQADVRAALGSSPKWDTWLFTDDIYVEIPGSQSVAVVLTLEGNWATQNDYNTMRFPRLCTTYYADVARDADGNITKDDTRHKILKTFKVINRFLHVPSNTAMTWGDLRVLGSKSLNEPYPRPWNDGDKAATAQVFYAITLG